MKLTVKEYATLNKISVQTVYKQIQKNQIEHREENGTKFVIVQDKIDYEKMYSELKIKHEALLEILKMKDEIILELKQNQKLFNLLLPSPKKNLDEHEQKKNKKDKKKNKKNKKKVETN